MQVSNFALWILLKEPREELRELYASSELYSMNIA